MGNTLTRQYNDVKEIFRVGGNIPDTNYLFLGDYVDRGACGLETILLLYLYKILHPCRINLLRGNHETKQITQTYGFYTECQKKYKSTKEWQYITDAFNYLPISAVIDSTIFCVHAGLSPSIKFISSIETLNRIQEIPHDGPFADLMWSDPDPEPTSEGFKYSARGAGFMFGENIVNMFLHNNGVKKIVRAHQLCMDGYTKLFNGSFITVWSAPNYCYRFKNLASILELDDQLNERFNTFKEAPCDQEVPIDSDFKLMDDDKQTVPESKN